MAAARAASSDTQVERILASVEVPTRHERRPALAVLVGLPGTGKTRIARELRARTGAVVLESDELRRLLFRRRSYTKAESRKLFAAVHQAIERLLAEGVSVILDATNVAEAERAPLYEMAQRHNARLVLVQVTAPPSLVKQRLAERHANGAGHSEAGGEVYEEMRWREEEIARPHHVIDTSKPVDRAVAAIAKEMQP
jgi:predicted kinase